MDQIQDALGQAGGIPAWIPPPEVPERAGRPVCGRTAGRYTESGVEPLSDAFANPERLKVLQEINVRVHGLVEFNQAHARRWTPDEFAQYRKLFLEWESAVDQLARFEKAHIDASNNCGQKEKRAG